MTDVKKIALVFSGQGAQYPGMGKSLYDSSAAAKAVFDEAGDWIKDMCFEGTAEELKETSTTQPAVYTVDMAAYAALNEKLDCHAEPVLCSDTVLAMTGKDIGDISRRGVSPSAEERGHAARAAECPQIAQISAVAGFSLGEYAAFTAAGIIPDVKTGFDLVCKRSILMADAGRYPDGSPRGVMAAVLGDKDDILALVEASRGNDVLEAANFNSATQTVIAGDALAVTRFSANAKDSGKRLKAIPLAVSTAFHTPIMSPAANGIIDAASDIKFGEAIYPVYLNMTGETLDTYLADKKEYQEAVQSVLGIQVESAVQWQKTIEAIADIGVDAIIELGPGKTLSGLTKKNAPGVLSLHVEDAESLNETIGALRND